MAKYKISDDEEESCVYYDGELIAMFFNKSGSFSGRDAAKRFVAREEHLDQLAEALFDTNVSAKHEE